MKHIYLTFLLLVIILVSRKEAATVYQNTVPGKTAAVVFSDQNSVIIEFNLPELLETSKSLPEFGRGTLFRVPGYTEGHYRVGMPDVPVVGQKVHVPNTGKVMLEIISEKTEPLGVYRVVPFQKPPTHNGEVFPFEMNEEVYSVSQYYPQSAAEISSVEILRDIRVACVSFNPVRVNPVTGEVLLVTSARVKLTFANVEGVNELHRKYKGVTKSYIPFYKDVLNVSLDHLEIPDKEDVGCYMFLGTTETLAAVKDLIDWKKRKGYDVNVADVDTVGSSSGDIDSWIEDAYNNWDNPPEYIFIIGGEDDVPPPKTSSYESDNKFGVVGSGSTPSIHVGRITAKDGNVDNLTYQAWKILMHETEPFEGEWLTKAETWGCSNPNGEPSASKWAGILEDGGLTVTVELQASGGAKGAELVGHFNDGLCTFGYKGHGNYSSMSSASVSVSTLADNIDNGRMLTWVNNIGCNCANFSGKYCVAEAMMCEGSIEDPKGALGTFAYTVSSSVGGSDNQLSGIYEALMGDDPALWHVGAACDYGKTQGGSSSDIAGGMLWGCPEIELYTVNPIPQLQASYTMPVKGDFTITVTDGSSPVEGALIGVVTQDTHERLGAGYSDASGALTVTLPDFSGDAYVTATYHNFKPYLGDLSTGIHNGLSGNETMFMLGAAVPNPIRTSTAIRYSIPEAGNVQFEIYNLNGKMVYQYDLNYDKVGVHSITWNGKTNAGKLVPNGAYIYKLTTKHGSLTRSCLVMR